MKQWSRYFFLEETKLEDPLIIVEQEITLRRNFIITYKNARGASGGLSLESIIINSKF